MPVELDEFTRAYLEAALWSTNDESTPEGGEPLDANYTIDDFAPDALEKIKVDCTKFQAENWDDICSELGRAGHDFWLTRCRHGSGFFDGDWGDLGDKLTEACKAYKEINLYVGDDGLIYCD